MVLESCRRAKSAFQTSSASQIYYSFLIIVERVERALVLFVSLFNWTA